MFSTETSEATRPNFARRRKRHAPTEDHIHGRSLKIPTARQGWFVVFSPSSKTENIMAKKTCAACDCDLDDKPIKVKIGGKTVEVCCDDCAKRLKEADTSAKRD